MDSNQIALIASQANAVSNPRVFCIYRFDGGKFRWIFYRRGEMGNKRLGHTSDPSKVMAKAAKYANAK